MHEIDLTGPRYEDLSPLTPMTAAVPLHDDLIDRLVQAKEHPDPTVAHVLASCSGYAYGDTQPLRPQPAAKQATEILGITMAAPLEFVADRISWLRGAVIRFPYVAEDHFPLHYIAALNPDSASSLSGTSGGAAVVSVPNRVSAK